MPEMPKLAPEVELPRPRSSGVAVVAVAALAMFTAVGASAFIVRVRMGMASSSVFRGIEPPVARIGPRIDLVSAYVAAAQDHDDRAALELYQQIPAEMDTTGRLAAMRDRIVARQNALLQQEIARGDCDELRRHVSWLRQLTPEGLSVHVGECRTDPR